MCVTKTDVIHHEIGASVANRVLWLADVRLGSVPLRAGQPSVHTVNVSFCLVFGRPLLAAVA